MREADDVRKGQAPRCSSGTSSSVASGSGSLRRHSRRPSRRWRSSSGSPGRSIETATRRRARGVPALASTIPTTSCRSSWLEARERILRAAERHARSRRGFALLLVCGAARNDGTCPGEISKSFRLSEVARDTLEVEEPELEVDVLDLSLLSSEYGRQIHPCKACVSTAMPLCHWPCSCYPNHGQGQVNDWMNELYERWTLAHGVLIVTPVYWYQVPSGLKLMIDRLVCADGGNPDPTLTGGEDAARAKAVELAGWSYPKHLAGRVFGVVVHGDVAGVESVRRALCDWLEWMGLRDAGGKSKLDRYIGYYEPYATSHRALDDDDAVQEEVRNAARAVARGIRAQRAGEPLTADQDLVTPRPK